jgi:hypothetical protein
MKNERRFHQVKTRLVLILVSLAAIVAAGVWALPSFLSLRQVTFEKERLTNEAKPIAVRTRVDGFGVRKGDPISYQVEVQYHIESVSEIDKTSLDKSISFKPFEVRSVAEREYDLDPQTRTYTRDYLIQLIDGKTDMLYEFPTLLIRYKLKESGVYEEKTTIPAPVFIASRLPSDVGSLDLKPIQAGIEDAGRSNLHWILFALGGFLVIVALVDLAWRAVPQWRTAAREKRRSEGVDVLSEAYRSLRAAIEQGAEPGRLLYQVDHILRVVLARKENTGWTDEPDFDRVSPGIKAEVLSLYSTCQETGGNQPPGQQKAQEAARQIETILRFYCGEGALRAWKR